MKANAQFPPNRLFICPHFDSLHFSQPGLVGFAALYAGRDPWTGLECSAQILDVIWNAMATASLANVRRELDLQMLSRASAQNSELCQCSSSISILFFFKASLKVARGSDLRMLTSMLKRTKPFSALTLKSSFTRTHHFFGNANNRSTMCILSMLSA